MTAPDPESADIAGVKSACEPESSDRPPDWEARLGFVAGTIPE